MSRTTEAEIADAVVAVLSGKPNGEATIAELINEIPNHITLSAQDLAPSPTRNGEAVWEQQVRNITSHKGSLAMPFTRETSFDPRRPAAPKQG